MVFFLGQLRKSIYISFLGLQQSIPQTGWLKTTEIYSFAVMAAESLKSQCWRRSTLSKKEASFLASSSFWWPGLPWACGRIIPISASVSTGSSSLCLCVFFCLFLFCFLLIGHTVWPVWSQLPDQRSNPSPMQWTLKVLTTGPPGTSPVSSFLSMDTCHWIQDHSHPG